MRRLYHRDAYRTEPVRSWWADSTPPADPAATPPLRRDADTDVAIIGAGYCGLNAALDLAASGARVTVLDAARPGWGASGRNGGFVCLGGTKRSWADIIARDGLDVARAFWRMQCDAITTVRDNLARYGIDADPCPGGETVLAHSRHALDALARKADLLRSRFDAPVRMIDPAALTDRGQSAPFFHGAMQIDLGFGLNPMKYVLGLARAAREVGVTLHAETPVTSITRQAGRLHLETPQGRLAADRLIIATNGYASEDIPPWMGGRTLPALSAIMVTRPLTGDELQDQGWTSSVTSADTRSLLHYFRLLPDGRFLFGMRGGTSGSPAEATAIAARLRRDFAGLFPAWAGVEASHIWSGLICLTRNLSLHVGPVPDLPGAFAAFGCHGGGVAMMSHAGRLLGRMAAGQPVDLPPMVAAPPRRFPPFRLSTLRAAYLWYGCKDRA